MSATKSVKKTVKTQATKAKATELIDRIINGFKVGEPGGRAQQR